MAAIVQRALSRTLAGSTGDDSEFRLSDDEKDELMRLYKESDPKEKQENKPTKKKFDDIIKEESEES